MGDKSKLLNGDVQSVLYVAAVVSADEKLSLFRLGGGDSQQRRHCENIYRIQSERKLLFPSVDGI